MSRSDSASNPIVVYVQPSRGDFPAPGTWKFNENILILVSDFPVAIEAFISSQYARGVRHFVLNISSALLEPLMIVIGASDLATFVSPYSSADALRAMAPPNCLFCVGSDSSFLPSAFSLAEAEKSTTGPLITVLGGAGAYISDVEEVSKSLQIPTYRLPQDMAALTKVLYVASAVVLAIGSDVNISQLNIKLLAFTGKLYCLDIALPYSKSYFLISSDGPFTLNAVKESSRLRSSLTGTLLPNTSVAVVLVRKAKDWERFKKDNLLGSGLTEFGVAVAKVNASPRGW